MDAVTNDALSHSKAIFAFESKVNLPLNLPFLLPFSMLLSAELIQVKPLMNRR